MSDPAARTPLTPTSGRATDSDTGRSRPSVHDLAACAPIGLFEADSGGDVVFVNARWCQLAGLSAERALGLGWLEAIHPDDRDRVSKEWSAAVRSGTDFSSEYRCAAADAATRWIACAARAIRLDDGSVKGFVGTTADLIGTRARVDGELRASRDRFERCVRGSSDGLWDFDIQTKAVYVSPRYKELLGYRDAEFNPDYADWDSRLHPDDRARTFEAFEEHLARNTEFDVEYRLRCRDGSYRWFRARGQATRDESGLPTRMAGSLSDVTLQRAAQAELSAHARYAVLVGEVGMAITQSGDLQAVLQRSCDALRRHLNAVLARVWTVNDGTNTLQVECTSAIGDPECAGSEDGSEVQSRIEWIAANRQPLLANDLGFDQPGEGTRWAGKAGVVSFAGCPLLLRGRVIGVLGVFARNSLDDLTLQTLHSVADAVAIGIDHQRASNQLKDIAAQMTSANRELSHRQEELQSMLESLRQVNDALECANVDAEAANRAKSEFLANMSHEIRTPMTAILGFAENLQDPSLTDAERRDAAQTILRHGRHLLDLINDILDLSRIEAGKLPIEATACSPREIAREVIGLLRGRAEAKGLAIELDCEPACARPVLTDARRLRQILINLVGNAIKFTDHGDVKVLVRLIEGRPPLLRVDVVDTGIGMTPAQAERVFQLFTQADTSMARRFGGTGLGLAISKRLAELLGGDTSLVYSSPDRGSCFRVMVAAPDAWNGDVSHPEAARSAVRPGHAQLSGARILLAEDSPDNQRLIAFILRRAGVELTIVDNGCAALDAIDSTRSGEAGFDIILMDMQMPILDGYEATRTLRARGYDGPVLALTAHAMAGDRDLCIRAGCDEVITKPIDRPRFTWTLADYLVRKTRPSPITSKR